MAEDAGLDNNLFTTISRELNKTTSTHAETKLAISTTLSSLSTVQRAIYRAEVKEAVRVVGSPSKLKSSGPTQLVKTPRTSGKRRRINTICQFAVTSHKEVAQITSMSKMQKMTIRMSVDKITRSVTLKSTKKIVKMLMGIKTKGTKEDRMTNRGQVVIN